MRLNRANVVHFAKNLGRVYERLDCGFVSDAIIASNAGAFPILARTEEASDIFLSNFKTSISGSTAWAPNRTRQSSTNLEEPTYPKWNIKRLIAGTNVNKAS